MIFNVGYFIIIFFAFPSFVLAVGSHQYAFSICTYTLKLPLSDTNGYSIALDMIFTFEFGNKLFT